MDNNKKWSGSNLVLDPETIQSKRKKIQEKFNSKKKYIKRGMYASIGVVILILSITLPLVLTSSSPTTTNTEDKTYTRNAVLDNGDVAIVKFNDQLLQDDEINPNNYKKNTLFKTAKTSMASTIPKTIYDYIISKELETFTKLGNKEALLVYIKNEIIKKEKEESEKNEESYLTKLMIKGYGIIDDTLTEDALLDEAVRQYFNSYEMNEKAYNYLLAMIYIAQSNSRYKVAANLSTLKELWYFKTTYLGNTKNIISRELSSNICDNLPEIPVVWGRISFNSWFSYWRKNDVINLLKDDFIEASDIRNVLPTNLLPNNSINSKLYEYVREQISEASKRSTKEQIVNAIKNAPASNFLLTTREKNSLTSNSSWSSIRAVLLRSLFLNIQKALNNDENFKTDFIQSQLTSLQTKLDTQTNLLNYATSLGLNPSANSSDSELKQLIKNVWEDQLSTALTNFLQTSESNIQQEAVPFSNSGWLASVPINEYDELKNIFSEFLPLATLDELSTFVSDTIKNSDPISKVQNVYNDTFINLLSSRITTILNNKYTDDEKSAFVFKYKDNPALDNNAHTWKRLSIFIARVLINEISTLLNESTKENTYITSEVQIIEDSIQSWNLEKLKEYSSAINLNYDDTTTIETLRTNFISAWNTKIQNMVNSFKNMNKSTLKTNVINYLIQYVVPNKSCGSLDNWNKYVLDININKDETYNQKRETYGLEEERKFGYMGFIRKSNTPNILNEEMKDSIYRTTSGSNKFQSGLQEREDFDGIKRPYFITTEDDTTYISFIVAKEADEEKYWFDNAGFDLEYSRNLLYTIVSTSTLHLSNAREYYFSKTKYRVFFYDDIVSSKIKSTLNPNNVKNPTKNSNVDPVKETDGFQ